MTNAVQTPHVSTVSEADFLARVAAFERNEEAEARRAKDAMRRMVSDQTKPPRHDNRGGGPTSRRDRSPSTGPAVGIFRDFPYHFTGAIPTSCQPPPHPVAGFHIYGHHTASSVYPFFEIQTGGPPPLQDAYHDALILASTPYLATPFASHTARLSDPAPFPGGTAAAAAVPPFMIVPHPSSYYPHPDLTRDTNDRGRSRAARQQSYSPDRDHHLARANTTWQYTNTPGNPHGYRTPAPPAPPPRLSSTLAPPTSPASLAFHRSVPSSSNKVDTAAAHAEPNQHQKRATSVRIDYDLRTHPASLRVSPASSTILSKPASVQRELANIRLNTSRA